MKNNYLVLLLSVSVLTFWGCKNPIIQPLSSDKSITAFSFPNPAAVGVIDESAGAIAVTLPFNTDVTALVPAITQTGISISPATGTAQDFTVPVTYKTTAEDGSTRAYQVTVSVSSSSEKAITAFSFASPAAIGAIDESAGTIAVTVPFGTNLTDLVPSISFSGTTISPESDTAQDFTGMVTFTVTAADGGTKAYAVTVTIAPNPARAISIGPLSGGEISSDLASALPGATVTLTVTPAAGKDLKEGSLGYTPASASTVAISEGSFQFAMPDSDVTISAQFIDAATRYHLAIHPSWVLNDRSMVLIKVVFIKNSIYAQLGSGDLEYLLMTNPGSGYVYADRELAMDNPDSFYVTPEALTETAVNPIDRMMGDSMTGVTVLKNADGNYIVEVAFADMALPLWPVRYGDETPALSEIMSGYTPFIAGEIVTDSTIGVTYGSEMHFEQTKVVRMMRSDQPLNAPIPAPTSKVEFVSNGGSAVASITAKCGYIFTEPAEPVMGGFSFIGWFTDPMLTAVWDFRSDVMPSADFTLYAKWTSGYLLSLGKGVAVSSTSWWCVASDAVDGNLASSWVCDLWAGTIPWIYVDLGSEKTVSGIRVIFGSWHDQYRLQYSNDAATWTDIGSPYPVVTMNSVVPGTPVTARYVRVIGIESNAFLDMVELSVYGD
jgi:uncharacterized repeat protein (TIGR02543 family)